MTADDIAYGRRLVDAVFCLQGFRTLRLLARDRGIGFAGIIEDWLDWRPPDQAGEVDSETLKAFVARVCGRRGIPARFYQEFAALEFPAARMRSATRTTSAIAFTP